LGMVEALKFQRSTVHRSEARALERGNVTRLRRSA
jgi:hypothetical protein